ncbi:hypothetical protein [Paracoccus sp. PAR01]|uniref:hypothetical protein n=1 Tax=Paracoccus TaxID=265 RepID=UPI0017871342|nr:hypothetical protein [Paracoccus sp. PAR01]MBD9529268.1 hypothetical protein [Paracoccus sp. PAR01]
MPGGPPILPSELPVLIDRYHSDGALLEINPAQQEFLGLDAGDKPTLKTMYSSDSAEFLRDVLEGRVQPQASVPLWMLGRDDVEHPVVATLCRTDAGLLVCKLPLGAQALSLQDEMIERVEILSGMIGEAREAYWCIEFLEPIDVTQPEDAIIAQVFGNASCWRACNRAMAELYAVPEGLDFNDQPVSRYFPDTPVNREMLRDLIRAGYRLDGAVAIDQRHGGEAILVENDFRARIAEGRLVRLWGTVRDISANRAREQDLNDRADRMRDILGALPDPVLLLSAEGFVLAANPAADAAFEGRNLLGRAFDQIAAHKAAFQTLRTAAVLRDTGEIAMNLPAAKGSRRGWLLRVAFSDGIRGQMVVTARPQRTRPRKEREEA